MSPTFTVALPGPRTRLIISLGAGALLAAGLLGPALAPRVIPQNARAADEEGSVKEHRITVAGMGRVTLRPDIADVRLGVSVTRPTVTAARQTAAEQMTKVLAAIKGSGVADADVATSVLSLQPAYDDKPTSGRPHITGYTFSNVVTVTVRDLESIGRIVDGAIAAGATSAEDISFRVEKQTAAERQARDAAMADARAKADALAAAAGLTIRGVASINETAGPIPYGTPVRDEMAFARQAASMPTPIQPGTNEVTVTVTVGYTID